MKIKTQVKKRVLLSKVDRGLTKVRKKQKASMKKEAKLTAAAEMEFKIDIKPSNSAGNEEQNLKKLLAVAKKRRMKGVLGLNPSKVEGGKRKFPDRRPSLRTVNTSHLQQDEATSKMEETNETDLYSSSPLHSEHESKRQVLYIRMPKLIDNKAEIHVLHKEILKVKLPKQHYSRFCFIECEDEESAQRICAEVDGKWLQEGKVVVKNKGPAQKSHLKDLTRLHASGLPKSTTKENLKEIFPTSTSVFIPQTGKKAKTYGFASFKDHTAAKKAFHCSIGKKIRGQKIFVTYADHKDRILEKKEKWKARKNSHN